MYAKGPEAMGRFYSQVCGLEATTRDRGFIVLERGALQLVIVAIPPHIAATIQVASPPVRQEDSAHKLMFVVPSIAAARALAPSLGGVVDPEEREWEFQGMRVCDGHDPEGNVVQLRQHG
ncbi:MAG: glyoxalase/bleomycin resistance/dioxygenase family protein [Burkholderiales bacterium]|nr:glyoxalase/bleomycin resistance/dioxygenase family protein [Burkholderiales bacterium]